MVPEVKKEAPAPPKMEAKAKALKAKKAVLKGIHNHKKKIHTSPTFQRPMTCNSKGKPNIHRRVLPGETSLTTMLSSSSLLPLNQP
ncbi:hypothetical protein J0S82_019868 [Galemys pyrenaicus]|uniref:Large ribosomal subunit protein uL23 N-terminal domain-containing protein n=1 Tax=Galemys pyrenaicus TaxID=202257 RepID=A0A8J6AK68_GALPY|nr:hypothetical protein J0S82_019868 [Galemys pyrenaicus]